MKNLKELLGLVELAIGKLSDTEARVIVQQISQNMILLQSLQYDTIGHILITASNVSGNITFHFLPPPFMTGFAGIEDIIVSAEDLPENKGQQQITAYVLDIYNAVVA